MKRLQNNSELEPTIYREFFPFSFPWAGRERERERKSVLGKEKKAP